jgi:hypothetical protein
MMAAHAKWLPFYIHAMKPTGFIALGSGLTRFGLEQAGFVCLPRKGACGTVSLAAPWLSSPMTMHALMAWHPASLNRFERNAETMAGVMYRAVRATNVDTVPEDTSAASPMDTVFKLTFTEGTSYSQQQQDAISSLPVDFASLTLQMLLRSPDGPQLNRALEFVSSLTVDQKSALVVCIDARLFHGDKVATGKDIGARPLLDPPIVQALHKLLDAVYECLVVSFSHCTPAFFFEFIANPQKVHAYKKAVKFEIMPDPLGTPTELDFAIDATVLARLFGENQQLSRLVVPVSAVPVTGASNVLQGVSVNEIVVVVPSIPSGVSTLAFPLTVAGCTVTVTKTFCFGDGREYKINKKGRIVCALRSAWGT